MLTYGTGRTVVLSCWAVVPVCSQELCKKMGGAYWGKAERGPDKEELDAAGLRGTKHCESSDGFVGNCS